MKDLFWTLLYGFFLLCMLLFMGVVMRVIRKYSVPEQV